MFSVFKISLKITEELELASVWKVNWEKIGYELIIVEARQWVLSNSLYYFLYI